MEKLPGIKGSQQSGILDLLLRHGNKEEKASQAAANAANPEPREVRRAEAVSLSPLATEAVHFERGYTLLKGSARSTSSGFGHLPWTQQRSDLVPGQYEGGFKLWECSLDLVESLRKEIQDGRLSFRGKDVLELGCGHGLPGILACLKGASSVYFQDFNAEVLINLTIPNVDANVAAAAAAAESGEHTAQCGAQPSPPKRRSVSPLGLRNLVPSKRSGGVSPNAKSAAKPVIGTSPSGKPLHPKSPLPRAKVRFFAGDWDDVSTLLSSVEDDFRGVEVGRGGQCGPGVAQSLVEDEARDRGGAEIRGGGGEGAGQGANVIPLGGGGGGEGAVLGGGSLGAVAMELDKAMEEEEEKMAATSSSPSAACVTGGPEQPVAGPIHGFPSLKFGVGPVKEQRVTGAIDAFPSLKFGVGPTQGILSEQAVVGPTSSPATLGSTGGPEVSSLPQSTTAAQVPGPKLPLSIDVASGFSASASMGESQECHESTEHTGVDLHRAAMAGTRGETSSTSGEAAFPSLDAHGCPESTMGGLFGPGEIPASGIAGFSLSPQPLPAGSASAGSPQLFPSAADRNSIVGSPLAYHKVLEGSPAFSSRLEEHMARPQRTTLGDEGAAKNKGGYDVILTAETVYNVQSLPKLLRLLKKCLRSPYGVVYLAAKKHYFGVGGGSRKFLELVKEDGVLHAKLLSEIADGASNVREVWKLFYKP